MVMEQVPRPSLLLPFSKLPFVVSLGVTCKVSTEIGVWWMGSLQWHCFLGVPPRDAQSGGVGGSGALYFLNIPRALAAIGGPMALLPDFLW